ncbi:hypothetical protein OBE_10729, partial [human gut metagenome]
MPDLLTVPIFGLNASVSEDSLGNTALNIESDMTGVSVIKPTIFNI